MNENDELMVDTSSSTKDHLTKVVIGTVVSIAVSKLVEVAYDAVTHRIRNRNSVTDTLEV